MSDIHNTGPIQNQVINPIIHGNLVMYGERKVNRILTAVPSLTGDLIGREEDLMNLSAKLADNQHVVLVNGMGGVGKTTIATAYLEQKKDQFKHIAWIEQSDDFAMGLGNNTVLLQNLGLQRDEDPEANAKAILNALSNLAGPSLLVIDNADHKLASFRDYLPNGGQWQVLITSREELDFATTFSLAFLSEAAAMKLFNTYYKHDRNEKVLAEILEIIDYHTLTIELLAKICQECRISSLENIRDTLNQKGLAFNRRANIRSAHSGEERIEKLLPYLQAIFDIGDNISESQRQLLIHFVGLPPIPIPFPHLQEILVGEDAKEEAIDDLQFDLKELTRKGFISYEESADSYKMHRVIQTVIQTKFEVDLVQLDLLVDGISSFLTMRSGDALDGRFDLLHYGQHILDKYSSSDDPNGRVPAIMHEMAVILDLSGMLEPAEELLKDAIERNKVIWGSDHRYTARNQSTLGQLYQRSGDYPKAYELLMEANKKLLADKSSDNKIQVAFNYLTIGQIFAKQTFDNAKEQSKELIKLATKMLEEELGPDHSIVQINKLIFKLDDKSENGE